MRDRGVSNPGPKSIIAAAVAAIALGAVIWGVTSGVPSGARAGPVARNLGAAVFLVAAIATANFAYASSLLRRLRRGDGVIAQWVVSPDTYRRFRDGETARRRGKNNWRFPSEAPDGGLRVIFSDNSVAVGTTYFRLATTGMSRFASVRIERDAGPSIEFAMRLTAIGAMPMNQTARYRGKLRVPIADDAMIEAARVVAHFNAYLAS